MFARLTIDQEAYDISATVDDYFLKSADAPYYGQAQRCAAIHRTSSARV
jgi:hypothetical protein